MKDDYLWDRSGKPDPEIQQLEDILGELRYQPRPLDIPARTQTSRSRFFFRGLAVAAAIAMIVLGLGLWLGMQRRQGVEFTKTDSNPAEEENSTQAAASTVDEKKLSGLVASNGAEKKRSRKRSGSRPSRSSLALNADRTRPQPAGAGTLDPKELIEAEAAKDQLMLALRLTSSKLNLAQKRIQGAGSDNSVHNQHKIG
jgi:hypothetical protein